MQITLDFGAMAESLKKQLARFYVQEKELSHYQRDADAISRLMMRGLISESQAHAARKRLMKKVLSAIKGPKKENKKSRRVE